MTDTTEVTILFTDAVKELVAIGAAIGSNCETCFKFHYNEARKLGVTKEEIRLAVAVAETVKASPARSIAALADRYCSAPPAKATPCCCGSTSNPQPVDGSTPSRGSCC